MSSILQKLSLGYRPQDVYINELFAGIAQIDAGVTAVMDISQIHHSPEHSDAAIEGLRAAGRRAVFGYFEGWGEKAKYPGDARRIREQHFSSSDQLISMFMGGEIYLPGYEEAWKVGRDLSLPIALHVVGTFGMQPTFDELAKAGQIRPGLLFHPYDRHERYGVEGGGRRGRACHARRADRNADAARDAADPESARP